jgi:hypothetical protein
MLTVARALVKGPLVHQHWTTFQDLNEGVEEPALMLVLTMDFLCP